MKNNSASVLGKMSDMEGRLGSKMDAQEAKLLTTTEELKTL